METEKEFKEIFGKLSHDQLLDIAYNLKKEVVALQEKNSSLKSNVIKLSTADNWQFL